MKKIKYTEDTRRGAAGYIRSRKQIVLKAIRRLLMLNRSAFAVQVVRVSRVLA